MRCCPKEILMRKNVSVKTLTQNTPDGKLSGKQLALYIIYYILIYMGNSVYSTYIFVYFRSRGFSLFQIGILGMTGPVFSIVIQPVWSFMCDKSKSRTSVLKVMFAGSVCSVLMYPFVSSFAYTFAVTVLYMLFSTAVFPISNSIAVEAMNRAGYNFSTIRMGGTIGYIATVVLSGYCFKDNLSSLFSVSAALLSVCFVIVFFLDGKQARVCRNEKIGFFLAFRNKKLLFVLIFSMLIAIAEGFNDSFLSIRINALHYSNEFIGYSCGIAALTEIPVLVVMPKIYRKYSTASIIVFAGIMMAVRMIICSFAGSITGIFAAQLLQGFSYMTVHYSTVNFVNDELPPNAKSSGQGLLAVFQSGFGSIAGNLGGGSASNVIGITPVYGVIGFSLLAVSLTLTFVKVMKQKRLHLKSH